MPDNWVAQEDKTRQPQRYTKDSLNPILWNYANDHDEKVARE